MREGSKNVVLRVEPRALGVVGISGALSYGVPLAWTWILQVEWAWLDCMCLYHEFYENRFFS
jgi:nitrate/nitrite transporter NarK